MITIESVTMNLYEFILLVGAILLFLFALTMAIYYWWTNYVSVKDNESVFDKWKKDHSFQAIDKEYKIPYEWDRANAGGGFPSGCSSRPRFQPRCEADARCPAIRNSEAGRSISN